MPTLILMYHDLAEALDGVEAAHRPYVLEPAAFRRQMAAAAAAGLRSATVRDWQEAASAARALILTFDDGHVSNYNCALPILAERGLKATFFVTAGAVGKGETMSWAQIRELHRAGMEIGSHTLTHRPPATLNDDELRYELMESRRVLEDGLGAPVTSISSPTGFFNPRMRLIAAETGYRALCFGRAGMAAAGTDPYSLPRIAVKRSTSEKLFRKLLDFDRAAVGGLRLRQSALEFARRTLGVERYLRVRRLLMNRTGEERA